ncbi:MAG: nucleotidyltransferase domain-containing protein [Coriobacteriia bacterium]|nr:nucleotidyltransferase domain-containing protein [Coriobacteriia bacterium]
MKALDAQVEKQAEIDRASGLRGYSVTNRSKLISSIVEEYLLEGSGEKMTIQKISTTLYPVFKRAGILRAELFGSYARGEQTDASDVDILIDEGNVGGLAFFRLQRDLGEALGKHVDLQSFSGANKEFLEATRADRVVLYVS